uniref:SH2 domain containing 7 n=1 Tax=Amphilophus citrinellus TaxID=61819 RepID=A0A3Q0QXV6_AMPCI
CVLYRQQYPRSEKACHVSQSRPKDQKHTKSPCIRTCLKFVFKVRKRDFNVEGIENRLRELASKWFIETQVPFVVNNGLLPAWFLGFITRQDAEELLREKELGCFLIRLSEKAIGYILSYRGQDRCRHFVITQKETGQFVVCGDNEGHDTVLDLIEYYKTSPIEPFGEYLTTSCFEALNEDLYDVIQVSPKEKPAAALGCAVKHRKKKQIISTIDEQPKRPPKSNRTHEVSPPLPRRSRHLDSSPINDHEGVLYAQLRKQSPRATPRDQHIDQESLPRPNLGRPENSTSRDQINGRCSPLSRPERSVLDSKSRSLPLLDSSSDGEQSYRLSAPLDTPPRLSPRPVRQGNGSSPQSERTDLSSRASSNHSLEYVSDNAVYHLAGRPGSPHTTSFDTRLSIPEEHTDSVYAEVSSEAPADFTYEPIRCQKETINPADQANSNTYEPLQDIRRKQMKSCCKIKVSKVFKNRVWKKHLIKISKQK